MTRRARRPRCGGSRSTARSLAVFGSRREKRLRSVSPSPGTTRLGAIYWFDRAQPGDPEYAGVPPTWRNYYATLWADSLASGAEALRRWDELEAATAAFRDSLFGSSIASRDHRRGFWHAQRPAQRDRHPARRRGALGLGRPAHRRGLLRGQLHPRLELPAGAPVALSRARKKAARDRVRLQPAS